MELRKRKFRGKTISETTVQKYLTVVSAVLSDAKRNEIIPKNPARMVDLPRTKCPEQVIPTDEEAQRFMDGLEKEPFRYAVFYALAIYTGCRRGELCALKWSDIIVEGYGGVMTVSRSRSTVPGQGVVEGPTKNKRSRTIYLSGPMLNVLWELCCQTLAEAKKGRFPHSPYVFVNEHGKPMHPDTFSKHLRRLYDKNGFPKAFHLHTLRHYFVSTLLHEGVDKQTVAELAGHGDTSFLERTYCHPQMALKQQAADRITGNMFPGYAMELLEVAST